MHIGLKITAYRKHYAIMFSHRKQELMSKLKAKH